MENNTELLSLCKEKALKWLSPAFDEQTKHQVNAMLSNEDKTQLIECFYQDLEFGTGGLRGIMGAGSNRMNIYTVGLATQGFANYLKKAFSTRTNISVVVCHDCRNNSRLFAETVANIFSANGIKAYLFDDMRPTPECSFAIRYLKCQAGVNVTASHNPKEYNGYKAYWEDGAQVIAPHDAGIIDEVNNTKIEDVKFTGDKSLIEIIGSDIDNVYIERIKEVRIDAEVIRSQHDLKIVYTPLHGTGMALIPQTLKSWGFDNVHCVKEQMVKSGDFPTVISPNPENGEALALALRDAKVIDADIVMASDPDADRVGMACKDDKGEWILINGNQTCLLFLYYILTNRKAKGLLKDTDFIVKTIVTTEVIAKIAEKQGIEMRDCYTGFKWIAREIALAEDLTSDQIGVQKKKQQYIGGGEESYGFLAQDFVRDKDAVSACALLAEICAWAKAQGKTLYDVLMDIYLEYGFSKEVTVNVVKPGKSGADEIKAMMTNFRNVPPKEIGGSKVVVYKDYLTLKKTLYSGEVTDIEMPTTSNVLQWFCEDGTKISVRPSGTEPKIKFYIEVKDSSMSCPSCYRRCLVDAEKKVEAIKKSLDL